MSAVEFLQTEPKTLRDLWMSCRRAFDELKSGAGAYVIQGVTIGTEITPWRHGLRGRVPAAALFIPDTGAEVFAEAQDSDGTYVYFQASGSLAGRIVVFP